MADREGAGPGGRPSTYSEEMTDRICEWIAEGQSLRSFVRDNSDSPAMSTICLWIVAHKEFSERYRRAREAAGYAHADGLLEVANEARQGLIEPNVAKVVMDAQKWSAERMAPKAHSPRQELSGPEGEAIKTESPLDRINSRLAGIAAAGKPDGDTDGPDA